MFSKKNRVKRSKFDVLLKKGTIYHTPYFSLRVKKNDANEPFSFTAVVSSKVIKTAVGRNLFKRRARAIVKELFLNKKEIWPITVALFLKKDGASLPYKQLKAQIIEVFRKV